MKNLYKIISVFAIILSITSCEDGIDPITQINPGPDAGAPVVEIAYPTDGTTIQDLNLESTIDIEFEVQDDIEISSVIVNVDGNQTASFNSFVDYRIFQTTVTKDGITTGDHTLEIIATDISGNQTIQIVTFSKEPPYTPLFNGEFLYMPFDGVYTDLISITNPEQIGNPQFAGVSYDGSNAFKATTDSYLSFELDQSNLGDEFTGAFWYKVDASPDRSGILTIGDDAADRFQGFRLFREGNSSSQRIKLNVGTGTGESWNDGDVIDVTAEEWVHVAFTISPTETVIYFNGLPVNTATPSGAIDWTNCTDLVIGAGGPTFDYWGHNSDNSVMDELRLFSVAMSQSEIQNLIDVTSPYEPLYQEKFYMPFDGSNFDFVGSTDATVIGNTLFAGESYEGSNAFLSATDSYLTYPISNIFGSTTAFSATFWYKVSATPDRAGILTVGDDAADRFQGFRLFREGNATEQRIKANIGTGTGESWNDGDVITVAAGEWVHIALTVSETESKIYFNGTEVNTNALSNPVDWTNCTEIVIGAGGPTFDYWGHASDSSPMDELRLFDRALTSEEINNMID
ncbi:MULTISPECIES: LamG-like jellyroll fold domain-containing protein [Mesoflavibacter]|uniref:Ig-like domain-containing protein n=1 Tax=Mesoflavibacter profundi TaxID=2708110 RepID=A0ABT4S180_9FLAO|nr:MULTISPECIES: LamG-like jellyroll fold domain-containing protein [Mesoflavibacter]MDA0177770.1 Ig-like domain-containing protein [Mesoflavibacter profundi]QIJ88730.1 hypothetical protein C7H62_0921 [Mesoflavibacter sp. HG96]QIJ91458.1 hypothetical protein C7H56_0921 [Mesoflavibacter sp. HG37]